MAQTKRKRKHRGTAAGTVEARGRTGRPPTSSRDQEDGGAEAPGAARPPADLARRRNRAAIAAVVFFVIAMVALGQPPAGAAALAAFAFLIYIPSGYYIDKFIYERRQRKQGEAAVASDAMDVRMFTVGPVMENCFIFRRDGSDKALIVDPGEEAPKLLNAIDELGVELEAILLTHTHFDHVGAVAPVAKATGAEVWVPEIEKPVLADIMSFVPWPGFGPYESYDAEHTLAGGERLELAGFEIDVIFTPGHSPGHVTFSIPDEQVVFSGDVLFQGSVGRTDLPGGDWPTLLESIRGLVDSLPGRDDRLSRAHGHHHARRGAGDEPVPGGAGPLSLQAPKGTFDVLPEDSPARLDLFNRSAASLARAGYALRGDARLRGHGAVRARRRRVHGHRPEGDVHASRTWAAAR